MIFVLENSIAIVTRLMPIAPPIATGTKKTQSFSVASSLFILITIFAAESYKPTAAKNDTDNAKVNIPKLNHGHCFILIFFIVSTI